MKKYIFGKRESIHIIDLTQTVELVNVALEKVYNTIINNGKILFVSTKKQASEAIAETAKETGQYYVNYRWLGGMLTNWSTIQIQIQRLKSLEQKEADGGFENLSKKEYSRQRKEIDKLRRLFNGIKDMTTLPDVVIFTNQLKDSLAIQECLRLGIPTICIVDSNCNPDLIPYPIPANDDSSSSINFILNYLVNRICLGYNISTNS